MNASHHAALNDAGGKEETLRPDVRLKHLYELSAVSALDSMELCLQERFNRLLSSDFQQPA